MFLVVMIPHRTGFRFGPATSSRRRRIDSCPRVHSDNLPPTRLGARLPGCPTRGSSRARVGRPSDGQPSLVDACSASRKERERELSSADRPRHSSTPLRSALRDRVDPCSVGPIRVPSGGRGVEPQGGAVEERGGQGGQGQEGVWGDALASESFRE